MGQYLASCHCGLLTMAFQSDKDTAALGSRACDCSFCQKIGGVWTSDAEGHVDIFEHAQDAIANYRFGTGTADFLRCGRCGTTLAALDGGKAVLNTRTFDDRDAFLSIAAVMHLGDESLSDRQNRRRVRWTPATIHRFKQERH